MAYSTLQFKQDLDRQGTAGLKNVARSETQRNLTNQQIEQAEKQQNKSTLASVSGMAVEKSLDGVAAASDAATAADTATLAKTAGDVEQVSSTLANTLEGAKALETGQTVAAGLGEAAGATVAETIAADGAAAVMTNAGVTGVAAAEAAAVTGAVVAEGAVAGGVAAVEGAGMMAAMGPWGWAGMAGLLAVGFLD